MQILRGSQLILVGLLVLLSTGAADPNVRYNTLGHKMICVCGCNQVLIECNHVGCQESRRMLTELQTNVSRGDADTKILQAFQSEYGPTALATPMFTRFNQAAWLIPPLVLLLGIAGVGMLVRKWRWNSVDMPNIPSTAAFREILHQIRKETEL